MRKELVLMFATFLLVVGCERFNTEVTEVVAYNASHDAVEFYVNNGPGHPVAPNSTAKFAVSIDVATKATGSTSPSYTVDKIVQVSVAVKNLRTDKLMPHQMCSAGGKVIMHISYEIDYYGYESLRCDATYPNMLGWLEKEMKEKMGLIEK